MSDRICLVCAKVFNDHGEARITCSRRCRDAKRRTGRTAGIANCNHCGRSFVKTLTELRRPHRYDYCSKTCARFHNTTVVTIPILDDAFGHWFAGLVDGEGSFWFEVSSVRIGFKFHITLRSDDAAILRFIQETLGFGSIYAKPGWTKTGIKANPQTVFQTSSTSASLALEAIFTKYPLRSKKQRDFVTWCKALHVALDPVRDITALRELQDKLVEDRRYHAQDTS